MGKCSGDRAAWVADLGPFPTRREIGKVSAEGGAPAAQPAELGGGTGSLGLAVSGLILVRGRWGLQL